MPSVLHVNCKACDRWETIWDEAIVALPDPRFKCAKCGGSETEFVRGHVAEINVDDHRRQEGR